MSSYGNKISEKDRSENYIREQPQSHDVLGTYSHHSIKPTGSIKRPGLDFFLKISIKHTVRSEKGRPKHLIVLSLLNDLV